MSEFTPQTHPWYGLRQVDDGLFEVQAYFGKMKIVFGLVAIASLVCLVYWIFSSPQFWYKQLGYYGIYWEKSEFWNNSYYQGCLVRHSFGCTSDTTFQEMLLKPERMAVNLDNRIGHIFILLLFLGPPLAFILPRRSAPMRFNVELGALYTWRKHWLFGSSLYILPKRDFTYKMHRFSDVLMGGSLDYGQAMITLQNTSWPRQNKRFDLGPYKMGFPNQGKYLLDALRLSLTKKRPAIGFLMTTAGYTPPPPTNDPLPYPWQHRSLMGKRKLPTDIDARAEAWMCEQGLYPQDQSI